MVEAVTTTRRRASSDGTSSSLGPLVLRICGSHREGQIVRLRSAKCTIGSGEHCTLRIRARGVQPLHCVLIRKAARTVVRRWATDTRLNGASFTDAPINAGDRLSIGPIEFEVLEAGTSRRADLSREEAFSEAVSGRVGNRDSLVEHLQAAKDLARKRTKKMLRRVRQANRRIEELMDELPESGTGGESARARQEVDREIDLAREALRAEAAQLREQQAELERRQGELRNRTESIAEQQRSLEEERQRWLDEQRHGDDVRQHALEERETLLKGREVDLACRLESLQQAEQALVVDRGRVGECQGTLGNRTPVG